MFTKKIQLLITLLIASACAANTWAHQDMPLFHAFKLKLDAGENRDNQSVKNWDLDGWIGTDENKLWLKSEGETAQQETEHSENWALYGRNIATFWDLQAGIRKDNQPASMHYFVAGFTGLAPYFFETEAHVFISEDGDSSFRLHQENDFLLSQKLILQPSLELNFSAQNVPKLEIGSGLSDATIGVQLRYEITRKFSPYIELSYARLFGKTADYAQQHGDDRNDNTITAGIQLMF